MSLLDVANEDLEVSFSNTSGPGDLAGGADQTLSTEMTAGTSTKCKAVGVNICTGTIDAVWTAVSGCPWTSATHTFIAGVGQITATATKTKAENVLVLRKTDAGVCAGSWLQIADGVTVVACTCDMEIADAGQTKVKAQ